MSKGKPVIAVAPHQFMICHVLDIGPDMLMNPDLRLCETHWPRTTCVCSHYRLEWHGERASTEGFDFELGRWT